MAARFRQLADHLDRIRENLNFIESAQCHSMIYLLESRNQLLHEELAQARGLLHYLEFGEFGLSPMEREYLSGVVFNVTDDFSINPFFHLSELIKYLDVATSDYRKQCEHYIQAGRTISRRMREYHYSPSGRGYRKARYRSEHPEVYQELSQKQQLP